jgi:hypothetical protein
MKRRFSFWIRINCSRSNPQISQITPNQKRNDAGFEAPFQFSLSVESYPGLTYRTLSAFLLACYRKRFCTIYHFGVTPKF